jgi:hypothetical protein
VISWNSLLSSAKSKHVTGHVENGRFYLKARKEKVTQDFRMGGWEGDMSLIISQTEFPFCFINTWESNASIFCKSSILCEDQQLVIFYTYFSLHFLSWGTNYWPCDVRTKRECAFLKSPIVMEARTLISRCSLHPGSSCNCLRPSTQKGHPPWFFIKCILWL